MSPRLPDELTERFAANLRRIRQTRNLSQRELAGLTDMHSTEISLLERAQREPRLETLIKLSAALDASIAELSDGLEWHSPPVSQSPVGRFRISPETD